MRRHAASIAGVSFPRLFLTTFFLGHQGFKDSDESRMLTAPLTVHQDCPSMNRLGCETLSLYGLRFPSLASRISRQLLDDQSGSGPTDSPNVASAEPPSPL